MQARSHKTQEFGTARMRRSAATRYGLPRVRSVLLPCVLIWSAVPAIAQETDTQPVSSQPAEHRRPADALDTDAELDDIRLLDMEIPVVVTASRHEQEITTVPYAMSVITAEDIRRSGVRSVPDALRLATGVDVAEVSFTASAVSPRGLHGVVSRQSLVLVDGRQIYNTWFGGVLFGDWPFQLEDIKRIEVIRGPAGVTWGANAVNGVINIITKDPREQQGLTIVGGGGSRGWQREHIGYGFGDDTFRMRISGEYEGSDGFTSGGMSLERPDDDYRTGRLTIHGIYEPDSLSRLTFSAGHGTVDEGSLRPPNTFPAQQTRPGAQASYVLGKWRHEIGRDNSIDLTGFVTDFYVCNGAKALDYRYQQFAFQLSHVFRPHRDHTVTWGLDTRAEIVDGSNSDPASLSKQFISSAIIGLYAQDEWRFAERWNLQVGGRIDYEFYGGFQPSGRVALSYELAKNAILFGSVSRAFQMPPATMRFTQLPLFGGLTYATVDRDLPAQSLIAYELGYRGRWFGRVDVGANVFWNSYRHIAVAGPTLGMPGLLQFQYNGESAAAIYGFEFESRWEVTNRLSLLGNYAYESLQWDASRPFYLTDAIDPPRHKLMLGARYSPLDRLHLSAQAYWVDATASPNPSNPISPKHIAPYWRLDLRGEYEFWNADAGSGSVAVGVRNLLDPRHVEGASSFLTEVEVPRMVYAELRLRIK